MNKIITDAEKNEQIRKEVIASILLYLAFFLWWYCTGYGVAEAAEPGTSRYVFGLPMWFFLSSVVGYFLFCIASVLVVRLVFRDFELGEEKQEDRGGEKCHTR